MAQLKHFAPAIMPIIPLQLTLQEFLNLRSLHQYAVAIRRDEAEALFATAGAENTPPDEALALCDQAALLVEQADIWQAIADKIARQRTEVRVALSSTNGEAHP